MGAGANAAAAMEGMFIAAADKASGLAARLRTDLPLMDCRLKRLVPSVADRRVRVNRETLPGAGIYRVLLNYRHFLRC